MIDLIGKVNNKVTANILYITGNLTSRSSSKTLKEYINNNTDFKKMLLDYLPVVKPNFVRRALLWNIANLVDNYSPMEKEIILVTLNEECLKNEDSNRAVLREALIIIVSISDTTNEVIINSLYEANIHETVLISFRALSEAMDEKDIILQIKLARIITNMTLGNATQIKVKFKV